MLLYSARSYNRAHWGDSLTAGTGASGPTGYYPYVVANSSPRGISHYNGGVGGNTSSQILTRMQAATTDLLNSTAIIWAGRNNFSNPTQVKNDIAAMVALLGHERFRVLSVINGNAVSERINGADYNLIAGLNSDLSDIYDDHYDDVRTPLVAAGAPDGPYPDPTSYAFDQPPSGLVNGSPHLNDAGYAIVAAIVYPQIAARGW